MVIDAHTHLFTDEIVSTYFSKNAGRVDRAVVLHYPTLLSNDLTRQRPLPLEELLALAERDRRLAIVGSVTVDDTLAAQLEQLEQLFTQKKIVGIKLYIGYQHFYPNDERVDKVAALCERHGKPLMFHTGDVYDPDGRALLKYSHPLGVDEVATRHPNLSIIIAHFGFPYLLETAMMVSKNKNMYADISGTIDGSVEQSGAETDALTRQYIEDLRRVYAYFPDLRGKTLFGTDYGGEETDLTLVAQYFDVMDALFEGKEKESVAGGLAAKLFGLV